MLVVEETVALAVTEKDKVVEFMGTTTLKVEEIVSFVGRGNATVVEFNGTMALMVEETVTLVGRGIAGVVEFEGITMPVDAGAGADALVGRGNASVVEFKGMTTFVEVVAEKDELLGAIVGSGDGDAVSMGLAGAPVPDGGRVGSELLPIEKGGRTLADSGGGSEVALPVGIGAKSVDEPVVMMTLVAAAVPLTMMVVKLPVMAPADSIVLPVMDSEDVSGVGKGTTNVVVLRGMITLVAAAVPLMLTVDRLAVITPPEPVAVPATAVLLVNGAGTEGGMAEVSTGLTVVTEGTNVLET